MNTQKIIAAAVAASLGVIVAGIVQTQIVTPTTKFVAKYAQRVVHKRVKPVEVVDAVALDCMATNLYFEARDRKTDDAFIAVGYTVLNRVNSKKYPKDVCSVVYQGMRTASGEFIRNKCQFSWVCDGKSDIPDTRNVLEARAWQRSRILARKVLLGAVDNPIKGATMYHATYVNPYWVKAFKRVTKIENHIFYS
jgi:spore germination cell wall hydrolase CwlJ-like protein